ncbi:MAG: Dabb family protein [Vicinamibacterales bacterium]
MVAHIVLFRPRTELPADERAALVGAFSHALREIPHLRRACVGRRVVHGRPYEQIMTEDFPYAVVLEFDDVDALKSYLQHPAHEELGARFFASFEAALMYDYEMSEDGTALGALP